MYNAELNSTNALIELTHDLNSISINLPSTHVNTIDAAMQVYNFMKTNSPQLNRSEKLLLIKSFSKAKARALLNDKTGDYSTFNTLHKISTELLSLL